MSCGVGCRCGSYPVLLWLWRRPAATALIRPPAGEPPYAVGVAQEMAKRQKKFFLSSYIHIYFHHVLSQVLGCSSLCCTAGPQCLSILFFFSLFIDFIFLGLWLWCRLAVTAPIQPLAWELPRAMGVALKKTKRKKIQAHRHTCTPEHRWCMGPWGYRYTLALTQAHICT